VNEFLARAGELFLAPAASQARVAAEPPADLVGVVAAPRDLPAVAGSIAAQLRRRQRARAALVCAPGPHGAGPALSASRTLARRLAARDLAASAAGAVCHVALPSGDDAVRRLWQAITAAAGHPSVVALPARTDRLDAFLAEADRLFLAPPSGADPAYTEAALASLAALGPPASLVAPPAGAVARRAAALGLRPLPLVVPA
jgi:hypothetical protein